ncbi:MAG: hypothetical protein IK053_00355 [Muribaculaceae bacterium]|nr:hypothetical protein [Muribaculaceae bacterium]
MPTPESGDLRFRTDRKPPQMRHRPDTQAPRGLWAVDLRPILLHSAEIAPLVNSINR